MARNVAGGSIEINEAEGPFTTFAEAPVGYYVNLFAGGPHVLVTFHVYGWHIETIAWNGELLEAEEVLR